MVADYDFDILKYIREMIRAGVACRYLLILNLFEVDDVKAGAQNLGARRIPVSGSVESLTCQSLQNNFTSNISLFQLPTAMSIPWS